MHCQLGYFHDLLVCGHLSQAGACELRVGPVTQTQPSQTAMLTGVVHQLRTQPLVETEMVPTDTRVMSLQTRIGRPGPAGRGVHRCF